MATPADTAAAPEHRRGRSFNLDSRLQRSFPVPKQTQAAAAAALISLPLIGPIRTDRVPMIYRRVLGLTRPARCPSPRRDLLRPLTHTCALFTGQNFHQRRFDRFQNPNRSWTQRRRGAVAWQEAPAIR